MPRPDWLDELSALIAPQQVITSPEALADHSYDWWPVAAKWRGQGKQPYRPDAVIRPVSTEQIGHILRWAAAHAIPVTPWGAGSGVTGAALAVQGGISLDLSAMNNVLMLDETNLLVRVQAGVMGHRLEKALNARRFTLNHSPQSLDRSTVGGWIATRAMGQFSSRWGGIEDLAQSLTAVLPTGEIVETVLAPRAAIGPDLRHLFIGSEGTLGVVTEVVLKIFPLAAHRVFDALTFPAIPAGLAAMRAIMQTGLRPFLVRFYDADEARHAMRNPDFSVPVMFLGFEGPPAVANAEYEAAAAICGEHGAQSIGPAPVESWLERRFDFSTVEGVLDTPGGVAETIEIAHLWSGIEETYCLLKERLAPFADEVLGHFSHVYPQGTSLYVILLGQAPDEAAAEERLMAIWETAMTTCLETGAAISHHHGVGLARTPYLRAALGSSGILLDRLKDALDPAHIMNPGKFDFTAPAGARTDDNGRK